MTALSLPQGFVPQLPNCGVVAIAIATGSDYGPVWDYFSAKQVRPKSWKGRTYHTHYPAAARHFGAKLVQLEIRGRVTVRSWVDRHTVKGATYIIRVSGHAMTVRDGMVIDNVIKHPVAADQCPKARSIVADAWRVEK